MVSTRVRLLASVAVVLACTVSPAAAQSVLVSAQGSPVLVPESQIVPQEILGTVPSAPLPVGDYQFSGGATPIPPPPPGHLMPKTDPLPMELRPVQPLMPAQPGCAAYAADAVPPIPAVSDSWFDSATGTACESVQFPLSFDICSGIVGGADMTILRPYAGDLKRLRVDLPAAGASVAIPFANNEFDLAPRLWLGYVNSNGLGVRARYWRFDQGLAAEGTNVTFTGTGLFPDGTVLASSGHLNMYAADLEVMQRTDFGLWRANFGGGIRFADISHSLSASLALPDQSGFLLDTSSRFSGIGPTVFAEFRRPLGCSQFSLVANARGTLLFGDWKNQVAASAVDTAGAQTPLVAIDEKTESVISVGEIQLGIEWAHQLHYGGKFFLNALWEGQIWTGSKSLTQVGNADVALMGVSFGAGITR